MLYELDPHHLESLRTEVLTFAATTCRLLIITPKKEDMMGGILMALGSVVVTFLLNALFLLVGAKVAKIDGAGFGKAALVTLLGWILGFVASFILGFVPVVGPILGIIAAIVIIIFLIQKFFATTLGKAFLAWLISFVIMVVLMIILWVVLGAAFFASMGGMGGLTG